MQTAETVPHAACDCLRQEASVCRLPQSLAGNDRLALAEPVAGCRTIAKASRTPAPPFQSGSQRTKSQRISIPHDSLRLTCDSLQLPHSSALPKYCKFHTQISMPAKACGFIKLHPTDPTELLRATVRKPPSASHTTRQYTPCIHDVLHTWANSELRNTQQIAHAALTHTQDVRMHAKHPREARRKQKHTPRMHARAACTHNARALHTQHTRSIHACSRHA